MDPNLRERLRLVIAVALAVAPKRVKQAYADRLVLRADEGRRELSEAVTVAVLQGYDVTPKAVEHAGAAALYRGPGAVRPRDC